MRTIASGFELQSESSSINPHSSIPKRPLTTQRINPISTTCMTLHQGLGLLTIALNLFTAARHRAHTDVALLISPLLSISSTHTPSWTMESSVVRPQTVLGLMPSMICNRPVEPPVARLTSVRGWWLAILGQTPPLAEH